jgi:two-component system, OmpR family, response regulator
VHIKTFIVEDSPVIRENLVATLEELTGVTVVGTAETEKEGVAWLTNRNNNWDIAIVDLFLKQGTGINIVTACKARSPNQTLIVLSNYATPDIRKQCALLGVDAVFDKSTEIEQLLEYCIKLCKP